MLEPRSPLALALLLCAACPPEAEVTTLVTGSSGSSSSTSGTSEGSSTTILPTTGTSAATETSTGTTTTTTTSASTGASSTGTAASTGESSSSGPPPPSCQDGVINQNETDLDCGGSCSPCLDGQMCAAPGDCVSTRCDGGICLAAECGVDEDCAPLAGPCASASCDVVAKKCVLEPLPDGTACDDGDLCTTIAGCVAGECLGGLPPDCTMLDSICAVGTCDPQDGSCVAAPKMEMEGMPCDDGFVCTPADVCSEGKCGPGGPGYAFFSDFSAANQGWQLGPTWQIGAAKASKKGGVGGSDPVSDHSLSGDNGLAGVVIGGLSEGGPQAKSCLTTPPIDTTVGKDVFVTFWRHLHTDSFPFVANQIEVFDGVDWIELELGYNSPVDDKNWQQFFIDLTEFSGEALQVRWCYTRNNGADSFAGWSIDDVTIGPYVCTPE